MKPSIDEIVERVKERSSPENLGMVLVHVGVVRGTSKTGEKVEGMNLEWDRQTLKKLVEETEKREGIEAVEVWMNEGKLSVGETIMVVAVGGRFRTDVIPALEELVKRVKGEVVREIETKS